MSKTTYAQAHDDMKGYLGTTLVGASQYTNRLFRNWGIAFPHMANGDVLTFQSQIFHRKKIINTG